MRFAIVEWLDTECVIKEEPPHALPLMKSIGWLIKKKDKIILFHLLTPQYKEDLSSTISTSIPTGCVKKIQYLK